jgi:hypothetical protein
VQVKAEGKTIYLRFVFDGEITEDDRESASCVATEVIADFLPPCDTICEECIQVDAPQAIPYDSGWKIVYQRKERQPET